MEASYTPMASLVLRNILTPVMSLLNVDPGLFYPFQGMFYFSTHPSLWGNLMLLTVPHITLTIAVIILCFMFLYPPQAALAFILNGPAGVVGSLIGMFQQSMGITRCISELFLFPKPLRVLFDNVLVQEGMDRLILNARASAPVQYDESDYQRTMRWFKALPRKVIFPFWLIMVLLRFFLSSIPIFGPLILIMMDAPGTVERCLGRYFELKGYDRPRINRFRNNHLIQWYLFGIMAATLESFPILGFTFAFSNTVGGALWAINVEKLANIDSEKIGKNRRQRILPIH